MALFRQGLGSEPDASFWKNKTVLVTGAGGFAGGHLCEHLDILGANVRCFIRSDEQSPVHGPRDKAIVGDVRDYNTVLEAMNGVDVAFHLAAVTAISEARSNVFDTFATNSLGTLNFLEAARTRKTSRLIYVSTCQVYGKQEKYPIAEDALPHPLDIYSASKLAGENLAGSFAEMYGMNVIILRPFNHYGPRQRPDFLIPDVMLRFLKGKELQLRNPSSTRDFTYVDDIVRGYILLAEKGKSAQVYHLSSGVERSVREIVDTIAELSGLNPEVSHASEPARLDISRSVGDHSKASKVTGWEPEVPFEKGLTRTLEWYQATLGNGISTGVQL